MDEHKARKITIFLKDGLPRGIRKVAIDQWSGQGVCAPRHRLDELVSIVEGIAGASVYFLLGESDDGGLPHVYVGENDDPNRFKNQARERDWWESVAVFIEPGMTKTRVQYLESIACENLRREGQCLLKNGNNPTKPTMPEEDIPGADLFYENIKVIMPLFGYDIFNSARDGASPNEKGAVEFTCSKDKEKIARGVLQKDGSILVLKDSRAVGTDTESYEKHPYKQLKEDLKSKGVLVRQGAWFIFVDDYTFSSPSAAASVILGRSANGLTEWRSKDDQKLKDAK